MRQKKMIIAALAAMLWLPEINIIRLFIVFLFIKYPKDFARCPPLWLAFERDDRKVIAVSSTSAPNDRQYSR